MYCWQVWQVIGHGSNGALLWVVPAASSPSSLRCTKAMTSLMVAHDEKGQPVEEKVSSGSVDLDHSRPAVAQYQRFAVNAPIRLSPTKEAQATLARRAGSASPASSLHPLALVVVTEARGFRVVDLQRGAVSRLWEVRKHRRKVTSC